jgi:hypothetical protein
MIGFMILTSPAHRRCHHLCCPRSRSWSRGPDPQAEPETAEQTAGFEFLEAALPAVGGAAETLANSRDLGGYHRLALAEEAADVIEEEQVMPEREAFEHSST